MFIIDITHHTQSKREIKQTNKKNKYIHANLPLSKKQIPLITKTGHKLNKE